MWLLQALLSGTAIALASMSASATDISQVPLLITTSAKPNIMFMLDSSGSMSNIVPDTPYNPSTTYTTSCSGTNLVPAGTSVDLWIVSNGPRIRYSGITYTFGNSGTGRCFATGSTYSGRLNADNSGQPSSYLDTDYSGNYLNWYFNASNTTPTWTTGQQKKPGTQSRIEIAKASARSLVDSLNNIRLGLSTYNSGNGGSLREIIGDVDAAKKTSIKTKIDALTASGNTPLAETLSDIGRYFATGATGNLTLHPGQSNQTTASVDTIFNSHNLRNDSSQTIANPIQYSCQKSFAVLMTDGRPQGDRNISASLRDYTGDCAASPSQCNATPNTVSLPSSPLTTTTQGNGTKLGRTYESDGSDYLDDVAKGLFEMDLRPDLAKTGGAKNNLITYTIGFADTTVTNDPLLSDTATRAGGLFLSAANSTGLTTAFQDALTAIDLDNQLASATPVAANSTQLNNGTQVYQASFNVANWSGTLAAFNINAGTPATGSSPAVLATGALTFAWQSSIPTSRNIYTYNPSAPTGSRGVLFTWNNLTKSTDSPAPVPFSQQAYLNTLNGLVDTNGSDRLNWLRGDTSKEKSSATDSNPAHIFLISKELQPAPSYWHGCQYPVTWMWMWIPRA